MDIGGWVVGWWAGPVIVRGWGGAVSNYLGFADSAGRKDTYGLATYLNP